MERHQIAELVKQKSLLIIENMTPEQFAENRSLRDLGADSLQIVEIVSACTRELKIKIPRTRFSEIKDIRGVIDTLHAAVQSTVAEL